MIETFLEMLTIGLELIKGQSGYYSFMHEFAVELIERKCECVETSRRNSLMSLSARSTSLVNVAAVSTTFQKSVTQLNLLSRA